MSDDFFKDELLESVMIPYKGMLKNYNAREIADLTFLYFLALQIMKSEFQTLPLSIDYLKHTFKWNNFDKFNRSGTDLYLMIHTLFGKDKDSFKMLKKDRANELLKDKINFDLNKAKAWVRPILANKTDNVSGDIRFMKELERGLQINNSDFRAIRRRVEQWNDIPEVQKSAAITRLIFAIKAKSVRSELLPSLTKLAKTRNLVMKNVKNPEKEGKNIKKFSLKAKTAAAIQDLSHTIKKSLTKEDKEIDIEENVTAGGIAATPSPLNKEPIKRIPDEEDIEETAMAGSVSAGAIASTPKPLFKNPVKRIPKNKKKKKK